MGVELDVTATQVASLDEVVRSDALIASAPEGEIGKVRDTVVAMAWLHAAQAAGVAVLTGLFLTLAWRRAGPTGRARIRAAVPQLLHHPGPLLRPVPLAIAVVVGLSWSGWHCPRSPASLDAAISWRPLTELFPEAASVPGLDAVQVADGAEVRGAATLIQGAIDTYQTSLDFYAALADAVPGIADRLHTPDDDEVVALFVSRPPRQHRHGRDDRAVARASGASLLIDGGDDTSSGASWETFSIDSLAEAARGARRGGGPRQPRPGRHGRGADGGA